MLCQTDKYYYYYRVGVLYKSADSVIKIYEYFYRVGVLQYLQISADSVIINIIIITESADSILPLLI